MPPSKLPYSQLSRTAKWYRDNPSGRRKKSILDTKINARPEQIKKRTEANQKRAIAIKGGKDIKNKDYDHATRRFVSIKKNRGRRGEGNR